MATVVPLDGLTIYWQFFHGLPRSGRTATEVWTVEAAAIHSEMTSQIIKEKTVLIDSNIRIITFLYGFLNKIDRNNAGSSWSRFFVKKKENLLRSVQPALIEIFT